MVEIDETDLIFAFPAVDEEAVLRVHFRLVDSLEQRIAIEADRGAPVRLRGEGPFLIYLQPTRALRDCKSLSLRYPFALLVSVGGKTAIPGVRSTPLDRTPQNYFPSPPQGG